MLGGVGLAHAVPATSRWVTSSSRAYAFWRTETAAALDPVDAFVCAARAWNTRLSWRSTMNRIELCPRLVFGP